MNSIPILYDNDEIFVINKPAGLPVQGGEHITHSLDNDFAKQVGSKVYLVHRLDKDTAGLMIVAKTPFAASKWTKLIGSKQVKKEYVAICCGRIAPKSGKITEVLEQHGQRKNAVTFYNVEKEWEVSYRPSAENQNDSGKKGEEGKVIEGKGDGQEAQEEIINMSTIRLTLETGRMHQIRIHLAKQNCPIAGDDQHGNFKVNKKLKKALKIKQLLLCSQKLYIPVAVDGNPNKSKMMTFEIPLPEHMVFE